MRFADLLSAALAAMVLLSAPVARAQVVETREGDANPMIAIFKSTLYGGGAGLLLGLAVELVDNDDEGDAVRWGFVSGTFFGFGYGVYHVSTRSEPDGYRAPAPPRWRGPRVEAVQVRPDFALRVRLATLRF